MSQLIPLDPAATPGDLIYRESPSQTAGPYVHIGLALEVAGLPLREIEIGNTMATDQANGTPIELVGTVFDGNGDIVRDVFIEAWQADADGTYQSAWQHDNAFNSFGRAAPDAFGEGQWRFHTIKPGACPDARGQMMAPHVALSVFARGINIALHTRLYFGDETRANESCPVLNAVESPARRRTLIATPEPGDSGRIRYRFDIVLQGEGETVFFDF
ncbi:protocatechuate 3,4-dioxygenase subunit alpha [Larsenimonas suaedae]|uniref:Protocatechuate 3,4-dioxygenase subunit alpha n=1 Tax=Larsenimonas suaedae TaxID=1851019 RepID=A0ABU1GYF2_9GAMM|nr:protocatechuate 3,4-dioxygenase subunit alpha [Larsenimonas suaedae]MCM2973554.1 protocatechuate 3,4-dioxygenase subunit alpha [Larsenimonas suaedae]MDR5897076.1 protocatechuate 3,4-dioxygenase subunit alpha [Larsenimonas suaedae]